MSGDTQHVTQHVAKIYTVYSKGEQGPPGPQGSSGDLHYTHDQMIASASWTVNHNLAKYPAVTVVDSAGSVVEGDVQHITANQTILTFSSAFAGKAYFN